MIKSREIKVNPDVLKTLRESSGYTVGKEKKKGTGTLSRGQKQEIAIATASGKLLRIGTSNKNAKYALEDRQQVFIYLANKLICHDKYFSCRTTMAGC